MNMHLERMDTLKRWFEDQSNILEPHAPLGPDEWSIAQVIEHLVTLERGIVVAMKRAKDPLPPRSPEDLAQLHWYVELLENAERYEVPDGVTLPQDQPDLPKLLEDWSTARLRLHHMIEQGQVPAPGVVAIHHPVAGPLNAEETFHFVASHLRYHQLRVEQCLAKNR